MKNLQKDFEKAVNLIKKHKNILIISHRNPDGDTVGANLALKTVLSKHFGKKVSSACADPLPESLKFLPESDSFIMQINKEKYDLIISVDCSSKDQLKFNEIENPIINIDHHPTNNNYGSVNIVDPDAASVTEILYDFFKFIEVDITPRTATNLLAGVYNDTGSFMHSNTTAYTYKIASVLVEAGASWSQIVENMFKTQSVQQLKLWGRVLSNARINKKGTIVSKVTQSDFKETHSSPQDLSGIINYLNSVSQSKMSILLAEDMHGHVKGSLRSKEDDIDVAMICEKFGGGGHKKAAGFTIPGKIVSEETWKIDDTTG
jgi:phosphoesterase RecJ-like protein